jgi:hypothetical protein
MSTLSDLYTEISTQLQLLVASATLIKLTRQQSATASIDTTVLTAAADHAARAVQRALGRTVDDSDVDAVDFGVRIALLRLVSFYSLTLTEGGAAYVAGVYSEMAEEATARRQAIDSIELSDENFEALDDRYSEEEWDLSNGQERD